MADNLTAGAQFSEGSEIEDLLRKILEALLSREIAAEVRSFSSIPARQLPDWANPTTGEWILYVDGDRMNEAMILIAEICGYSPLTGPID